MTALARPRVGSLYFAFNATPESSEWCTVTGSHYGTVVDPPAPRASLGAVFTTREAAEAYRAAAKPGTTAASDRPLVRVRYGGNLFRIVPEAVAAPECDCYPFGFTYDTFEGPQEHCPVHGRAES